MIVPFGKRVIQGVAVSLAILSALLMSCSRDDLPKPGQSSGRMVEILYPRNAHLWTSPLAVVVGYQDRVDQGRLRLKVDGQTVKGMRKDLYHARLSVFFLNLPKGTHEIRAEVVAYDPHPVEARRTQPRHAPDVIELGGIRKPTGGRVFSDSLKITITAVGPLRFSPVERSDLLVWRQGGLAMEGWLAEGKHTWLSHVRRGAFDLFWLLPKHALDAEDEIFSSSPQLRLPRAGGEGTIVAAACPGKQDRYLIATQYERDGKSALLLQFLGQDGKGEAWRFPVSHIMNRAYQDDVLPEAWLKHRKKIERSHTAILELEPNAPAMCDERSVALPIRFSCFDIACKGAPLQSAFLIAHAPESFTLIAPERNIYDPDRSYVLRGSQSLLPLGKGIWALVDWEKGEYRPLNKPLRRFRLPFAQLLPKGVSSGFYMRPYGLVSAASSLEVNAKGGSLYIDLEPHIGWRSVVKVRLSRMGMYGLVDGELFYAISTVE